MRALTLLQPYASAIAFGGKDWENRPQPVPATIPTGSWIALHAGSRWWEKTTIDSIRQVWPDCPPPENHTYGAILGVWQLLGCERFDLQDYDWLQKARLDPQSPVASPWAFGPYCYRVGQVRLLKVPLPCSGMQGWWRVPEDVAEKIYQEFPDLRPPTIQRSLF